MSTDLVTTANDAQMAVLTQRTPQSEIRYRDGKGGGKLAYVDHAYVTRTLNEAFGWDWDFEVDNEEILWNGEIPFEVRCRGRLTVRLQGRAIVKMQFGCQPIEMKRDKSGPVSLGDAYKGAGSDALKKCASLLGIALDLYDSDDTPAPPRNNGGAQYQRPQAPVTRQVVETKAEPLAPKMREIMVSRIRAHMHRSFDLGYEDKGGLGIDLMEMSDEELTAMGKEWKARADSLAAQAKEPVAA